MTRFLIAWIGTAGVGAVVVLAFGAALNVLELAGLAPLVGAGVLTFGFCLAAIHDAPVSPTTLAAVGAIVLGVAAPLAVWQARRAGGAMVSPAGRPGATAAVWIGGIALLTAYAFAMAWYWPPSGGDALTVWVLKGRNIRDAASIGASAANAAGLFYPLNLPLQVAALWPALGAEHIQFIFPAYLIGLVLVVAGFLSRRVRPADAWLFTLLVASTPALAGQAGLAMSDVAFTFYYVSSVLMLLRFLDTGSIGAVSLSGLLIALAAWTRADGLLYLAVNVLVIGVCGFRQGRRVRTAAGVAIVLALFIAIWWPWSRYAEAQGWGGHFEASGGAALAALARGEIRWNALGTVVGYFQQRWIALGVWGGLWLAFAASLFNAQRRRSLRVLLALIVLNIGGLLFTYYAFAFYRPDALRWAMDAGFDRMATHFAPLLWCYAAVALDEA